MEQKEQFICRKCHEKAGQEYRNIGAYGPCDLCHEIGGITLVNVKKIKEKVWSS